MIDKPDYLLFDIIESPMHPDLGSLCTELGLQRQVFTQQRKALAQLKHRPPQLLVADFFYGYGNNYAGANISNLDVLLHSVRRFAPDARVVVMAEPGERPHLSKLAELFELHATITLPADPAILREALTDSTR